MKAKVYYKFFLTLPEKEITHFPEKSKEQLKKTFALVCML